MPIQIRDSAPPVGEDDLSDLEARIRIELPVDYRSFLLGHNGGVPRPGWFHLRIPDEWVARRQAPGHLRELGQRRANSAILERWRDWHRIEWFFGVGTEHGPDSERQDVERLYRHRPTSLPDHLAPIAAVSGFQIDGWLCINVAPDGLERGQVLHWPAVTLTPGSGVIPTAPVARTFDALIEMLTDIGDEPPEWLPLVQDGNLDEFRRWLDRNGSRLREQDMWGWTSLDHAVFEGRWEIVADLMEKRDVTPSMVFYDAMVDGRFLVARAMLRLGVDAEFVEGALAREEKTFWADLANVCACLEADANVNHIDKDVSPGNTPLHFAAQAGEGDAVGLLLELGADPTVENRKGRLPRDLAAKAGYARVVEILDRATAARPARTASEAGGAIEVEAVDFHSVKIRGAAEGLDEGALRALEERMRVRLPGEYRAFLKLFNGGIPRPARFRFRDEGDRQVAGEVTRFLPVVGVEDCPCEQTDLESTREAFRGWPVSGRLLPIAGADDELSGGLLLISLSGKDRGQIYYYPQHDGTESSTYRLAKSLSGLFASLSKSKRKSPEWVDAIEDGDLDALQRCLDGDGPPMTKYRGRSPLEIAIHDGRSDVVRWLMDRGAKAKEAFEAAIESGRAGVLLDLLGRDEVRKIVPMDILGRLLHATSAWRNLELLRLLMDLGADVNAPHGSGMTPLMTAAQCATPDVLRLLLARGARAGVWSQQGELALHRAVWARPRSEMLEKMRILIDAAEALHARAPLSTLLDQVRKTARFMQTPIGGLSELDGPQATVLESLMESLTRVSGGLPMDSPAMPPRCEYLDQFRRTAAEALLELRKDPEALAELEAYASRRRTEGDLA